jgi:hypothetical protein
MVTILIQYICNRFSRIVIEKKIGESAHISYLVNHKEVLGRRYEDSMYQWMPAEFAVAKDGSVDIKSSYEL